MKAVIIEDETAAVTSLRAMLTENQVVQVDVIAELESVEECVDWFRNNPAPDLIFMDIHLADGSAFGLFEQVDVPSPVIFTTAFDSYALQAFQVNSIDYLLKPVTTASLARALEKLRRLTSEERNSHIEHTNDSIRTRHLLKNLLITKADKFYPLPVDEVCFFYTLNEKVMAYTADGKVHPVDRTLDALGEQLDGDTFFRANRQFIIARKAIRDIDLWFGSRLSVNLQIPLPERIIITKTKTPVFKRWIAAEQ